MKLYQNRKGVLLIAVMFMFALLSLTVIYIQRVIPSTRLAQAQVDRIKATFAAEAGLQKAIYYLNYTAPDGTVGGSYRIGTATSTACPSSGGTAGLSEVLTISGSDTVTYTMCIENSGYNVRITSTATITSGINGSITKTVQAKATQPLLAVTSGGVNAAQLAGRWSLSEGSGTTAADYSGNGKTGTLQNVGGSLPTWSSAALHDGVTHNFLTFNGSNYVLINDTMVQTGPFTVTGWIKPAAAQLTGGVSIGFLGNSQWAANPVTTARGEGFHIVFSGNDFDFLIEAPDATTNWTYSTWTGLLSAGTWAHFAAVNDGSAGHIYINGVEITTSSTVKNLYTASHNLRIGLDPQGGWNSGFTGSLADVRIYSRALTTTEILQIYNGYGSAIKLLRDSFKVLQ